LQVIKTISQIPSQLISTPGNLKIAKTSLTQGSPSRLATIPRTAIIAAEAKAELAVSFTFMGADHEG